MDLTIPYNYKPRDYQIPFLEALDNGIKRLIIVWHRRSGKDKTTLNALHKEMWKRVGNYFYVFPTYTQGRKILWDGIDGDGAKLLDHIPKNIRVKELTSTMFMELSNGSTLQVIGSDKIDTIVGTNPVGVVFSEYSLQSPLAWDYIRPILAQNDGWAAFNFTPRGKNHAFRLFEFAKRDSTWFCEKLGAYDTKALSEAVLDQERLEILAKNGDDALFRQEYLCDFNAPITGAYYATQLEIAERAGRITAVPWEPTIPVDTWWDLGVGDSTAIWFTQSVGMELRVLDYYESSGQGLSHYVKTLSERPYVYGTHNAPHDIEVRELGTGKSRRETAASLGIKFNVVPNLPIDDGIDAVRNIIHRCYFDELKCERGLDALRSYHKEYDEKRQDYKATPDHDWASHGADAFRYFAVGLKKTKAVVNLQPTQAYRPNASI